jgi:hypothetical protein
MADPVAVVEILEKVVGMAVAIVDAVKTARENKEECRELEKIVVRLRAILCRLKETDMAKDSMVGEALEDLGETLRRAHALVGACGKRNAVCRLCKAGKLSKRLRKVHEDISYKMLQAMWVSTMTILYIQPKDQHSSHLELFVPIDQQGRTAAIPLTTAAATAANGEEEPEPEPKLEPELVPQHVPPAPAADQLPRRPAEVHYSLLS